MRLMHIGHATRGMQSPPPHEQGWHMDLNRAARPSATTRCARVWFGTRVTEAVPSQ